MTTTDLLSLLYACENITFSWRRDLEVLCTNVFTEKQSCVLASYPAWVRGYLCAATDAVTVVSAELPFNQ